MLNNLIELPAFSEQGKLRAFSESPKGSRNKYTYLPEANCFQLSKVLPEGHVFPYDFGFIPGTLGDDGDPLDILILTDTAIPFPGCLIEVELLGVFEAQQTERNGVRMRNDRLLGRATVSRSHADLRTLSQLSRAVLEEIENFFISYNRQSGRKFKVLRRSGNVRAEQLVRAAVKRHEQQRCEA